MTRGKKMPSDIAYSKVAIVGTGMVGSSFAYALTIKGTVREIALIDLDEKRAKGEAMDLNHSLPFVSPVDINAGGYELSAGAQIVVITAGAAQKPGETRLDLAGKNAEITKEIVKNVLKFNPSPIILVTTNPVDILTYVAQKTSNLPVKKVIGSGTMLDSSRFRYLLSEHFDLDPRNVHAYVIGEHGDSEVPLWSRVHLGGAPIDEFCPICEKGIDLDARERIVSDVKNAAYKIIDYKGATYYAIGLSLARIVEAIIKDQHSVLTVSTLVNGYQGIEDVCLSLPCVVGSEGVVDVLNIRLSEDEACKLKESADILKRTLRELGYQE